MTLEPPTCNKSDTLGPVDFGGLGKNWRALYKGLYVALGRPPLPEFVEEIVFSSEAYLPITLCWHDPG